MIIDAIASWGLFSKSAACCAILESISWCRRKLVSSQFWCHVAIVSSKMAARRGQIWPVLSQGTFSKARKNADSLFSNADGLTLWEKVMTLLFLTIHWTSEQEMNNNSNEVYEKPANIRWNRGKRLKEVNALLLLASGWSPSKKMSEMTRLVNSSDRVSSSRNSLKQNILMAHISVTTE